MVSLDTMARLSVQFSLWIEKELFNILTFTILIANQIMIHSLSGFIGNWGLWLSNLIQLRVGLFDVLLLISLFIAGLGIINMNIAINLSKDRNRKMLLYPLMLVYSSFLFFVFLKSIIQEVIGAKSQWVKAEI